MGGQSISEIHIQTLSNTYRYIQKPLFIFEPKSQSSLKPHSVHFCNITGINVIKVKHVGWYFFFVWILLRIIYCFMLFIFIQLCADELRQRVNFNSSVNSSDLALSGEMRRAVEMEHLQPKETET